METWKQIKSVEVSSEGRVRIDGEIFTPNTDGHGYKYLLLDKFTRLHRLVAKAFIEKPNDEPMEVNHKNGIKTDNRVDNLEWLSKADNMRHAHRTGLVNTKGEQSHWVKLSAVEAMKIYLLARDGRLYHKEIGSLFGVQAKQVQRIQNKKRWPHIHEQGKKQQLLSEIPEGYCDSTYKAFDKSKRKGVKLNATQAKEIYDLAHNSELSYSVIASRYGICKSTITHIKQKVSWGHIHE